MKIVVGFENLAASDYIFAELERAGLPNDAEIVVVSATDMGAFDAKAEAEIAEILNPPAGATWQSNISQGDRDYLRRKVESAHRMADEKERELTVEAEAAVAEIAKRLPGASVKHSVVRDSPPTAILNAAKTLGADLIVVGSQNASKLSHFFLGSVSHKVMHQSETSVRIARAHAKSNENNLRVIVGFDGSPDSQTAVDAAAHPVWPAGTAVRVVTVAEEKSLGAFMANLMTGMWGEGASAHGRDEAAPDLVVRMAETAAARLREAGLNAEAISLTGDPKDTIMEMADEWNADAIFIGARGHRSKQGETMGAVANVLATRAHCSLELVRD